MLDPEMTEQDYQEVMRLSEGMWIIHDPRPDPRFEIDQGEPNE